MRDYLTLSWARFSKDVQSHTLSVPFIILLSQTPASHFPFLSSNYNLTRHLYLYLNRQITKILEYPAPRAGEMVKIDAGVSGESMEVVARFPGGLDFGRGLVDVNVRCSHLLSTLLLSFLFYVG